MSPFYFVSPPCGAQLALFYILEVAGSERLPAFAVSCRLAIFMWRPRHALLTKMYRLNDITNLGDYHMGLCLVIWSAFRLVVSGNSSAF